MDEPRRDPVLLLDACAVLSLHATDRFAEILASTPQPVAVVDVVVQESLFIRRVIDGESVRVSVDLNRFVETGVLALMVADNEQELQTFIDLAMHLDDGEAMTAALAIHRNGVLVTDDRKAERILAGRVRLQSTLGLIKEWAESKQVSHDVVRKALAGVDQRGYRPGRHHPLRQWWDDAMSRE